MPTLLTLVSKSKVSSDACSVVCFHQGSCGHLLPLDGFPVCSKCHCCPRHGGALSHLSTDIVNKLFIMKPNGEKRSLLKQLLFLRLFFSLWQLCFLYRQAIMRNCIKSVWRELIWAPFICFFSPLFFVHKHAHRRARLQTRTHTHTKPRAVDFLGRTGAGKHAQEGRRGDRVQRLMNRARTQNKWNVIVVVSPR